MKPVSKRQKAILLAGALITVVTGIIYWGNTAIQTTEYTIVSEKLNSVAGEVRIVQISDLHNASYGEKLIPKIREAAPDLIAVTGDLVDSRHPNPEAAMKVMRGAVQIAPVYYVPGNHEARSPEQYAELERQLLEAGVVVLVCQAEDITVKGQQIRFMGVKDPSFDRRTRMDEADAIMRENLEKLPYGGGDAVFSILLVHRPELFSVYAEKGMNLVLTGNAHGGQIRIPFVGGLFAPDQGLFPKYTAGLFRQGDTRMVVSRGLGASLFPVRVNNRPELVMVRLEGIKTES